MSRLRDDPIVAIATAAGRGGIGVVRLSFGAWSGEAIVARFVAALCGRSVALTPRHATMVAVRATDGAVIDRGIALLFAAPQSYTAEDVLELQLHGGPMVLQMVVSRCLAVADEAGDVSNGTYRSRMRLAAPGEFTERAYLNDKLDLAQAEAVADLIEASSEAAVLGAQASLSGAFSDEVHALVRALTELRALVEATLDFPDEEIDFLEQSDARGRLALTAEALATLMDRAKQGALLREGLTVVLVGRPNVGKSSLLNALAGSDVAIVTPIAGTTRDRIEQTIRLGAIVLHVIDTAGIRALDDGGDGSDNGSDDGSDDKGDGRLGDGQPDGVEAADGRDAKPGSARTVDPIERIGIARTWEAVAHAQVVLHLVDVASLADGERPEDEAIARRLPAHAARRTVVNKIDLSGDAARVEPALDRPDGVARLWLSAKTGAGIDLLRHELLVIAGWQPGAETGFIARERHLVALRAAAAHLAAAGEHADEGDRRLDLFAEELRLAQVELGRITGTVSADDLLGEIFGRFCIGK